MSVRKPRKEDSTPKKTRANAAKEAAASAGDKTVVKRKPSAPSSAPEKRTAAPKKTNRTVKKKAAGHAETRAARKASSRVETKKTKAKPPGQTILRKNTEPSATAAMKRTKGAKAVKAREAVAASPVRSGEKTAGKKTAKKQEKPLKGARRSSKRGTALTVAGRPARRKIPSLRNPALGKRMWEDRERFPELPKEYGENDLLIMAVDPGTVYAAWEITRDRLPGGAGDLSLRMVDVAGGGTSRDIRVGERVGSGFFEIQMPGMDVVAEIGLLSPDRLFRPILRSPVVSFPRLPAFDELGIIGKLFESALRAGY